MDGASGNLRRGEGFKICSSLACGVKEKNLKQVSVSLCFFFGGCFTLKLFVNKSTLVHVFVASHFFLKILPPPLVTSLHFFLAIK